MAHDCKYRKKLAEADRELARLAEDENLDANVRLAMQLLRMALDIGSLR